MKVLLPPNFLARDTYVVSPTLAADRFGNEFPILEPVSEDRIGERIFATPELERNCA